MYRNVYAVALNSLLVFSCENNRQRKDRSDPDLRLIQTAPSGRCLCACKIKNDFFRGGKGEHEWKIKRLSKKKMSWLGHSCFFIPKNKIVQENHFLYTGQSDLWSLFWVAIVWIVSSKKKLQILFSTWSQSDPEKVVFLFALLGAPRFPGKVHNLCTCAVIMPRRGYAHKWTVWRQLCDVSRWLTTG